MWTRCVISSSIRVQGHLQRINALCRMSIQACSLMMPMRYLTAQRQIYTSELRCGVLSCKDCPATCDTWAACDMYADRGHCAQLLKTMKNALLRQTADEVKQSKLVRHAPIHAAAKPKQRLHRDKAIEESVKTGSFSEGMTPSV